MYVGVHVPLGRESKRRHRHRGHKHHRKKKERDSEEGKEDGRESPSYGLTLFLTYNTQPNVLMPLVSTNSHIFSFFFFFSFPLSQNTPLYYFYNTVLCLLCLTFESLEICLFIHSLDSPQTINRNPCNP